MKEQNVIQRPDLILHLQQFFGIRQAHVTPTLSPSIVPVVLVGDLSKFSAASGHPGGSPTLPLRCGARVVEGPFPASSSRCKIRNPAGSGVALVFRYISHFNLVGALNADVGFQLNDPGEFTTLGASTGTDTRAKQPGVLGNASIRTVGIVSQETSGIFAVMTRFNVGDVPPNGFSLACDHHVVIGPGDSLIIEQPLFNVQLIANFLWTEEPLGT